VAGSALFAADITFLGINCDSADEGLADLQAVATSAGSLDGAGNPLVFSGIDAAAAAGATSAIQTLVSNVPIEVTIEAVDLPGDDGDALPFLDYFEVVTSGGSCSNSNAIDTDADGFAETFPSVLPGTTVCWTFNVADNTTVPPIATIQIFQLELTVRGDGAVLDQYTVTFVVPPGPPTSATIQ
ncbi:MAG: hypothetical protein CMP23_04620, partial [Rickettsiales bacterium]|nr:hypothetical protein [Rickettsiales bacterium]